MHVEIQVALNFLISFLYNKLPRRRVNQFGEELEAALKAKFANHWYPDQPAKGSAYRCLKTANPLDPVFEIAARNCGLELIDIQEYLPSELTIWVEPGEVSYRMSEKSPVKLLYQENEQNGLSKRVQQSFSNATEYRDNNNNVKLDANELAYAFDSAPNGNSNGPTVASEQPDASTGSPGISSSHSSTSSSVDSGFTDVDLGQRKVRSFNPEAQCFKPIESSTLLANSFASQTTANQYSNSMLVNNYSFSIQNSIQNSGSFNAAFGAGGSGGSNAAVYFNQPAASANPLKSPSTVLPTTSFTKPQAQTMTTAQFAQTKFGSTKLKTMNNSSTGAICGINGTTKRNYSNRMSPTEFSNYIKQRAILQQQQQQQQHSVNNLSQSLNGGHALHQLQVPGGTGTNNNNFAGFGNLFNSLSPQPSRSISPISNQDNFLLMAAAAVTSNGTNQATNSLNSMRNTLATNTSPISAANQLTGLNGSTMNSSGNSICSSLNSNSSSLKLMLNGNGGANQTHLLSPSSNSAPSGESLLSDINYLSELFNNTSLSPILGHSASLSGSMSGNPLNSSLNSAIKPPVSMTTASLNRFNPTPTSFLELNATNHFGNYSNLTANSLTSNGLASNGLTNGLGLGSLTGNNLNAGGSLNMVGGSLNGGQSKGEPQFGQDPNDPHANEHRQQSNNNQNSPKSSDNTDDKQFDSYSMSNGVIYPNQYQHLLVAN